MASRWKDALALGGGLIGVFGTILLAVKMAKASAAPVLPRYLNPGTETDLNDPGHYIGWFEAAPSFAGAFAFKPAPGWSIVKETENLTLGGHGGCAN